MELQDEVVHLDHGKRGRRRILMLETSDDVVLVALVLLLSVFLVLVLQLVLLVLAGAGTGAVCA